MSQLSNSLSAVLLLPSARPSAPPMIIATTKLMTTRASVMPT